MYNTLPAGSGLRKNKLALCVSYILMGCVAFGGSAFAQQSSDQNAESSTEQKEDKKSYKERLQIIGHNKQLRTEAGSATLISDVTLEAFEYDDINRVLAVVPGVNIREEDGYGLRPNIGFRGATPERSKKIALMEDGILIAPAPYSAPAAYYFPMVSRMTAVEVFKGPAAIKYGPNTVAGALNMTSRQVPDAAEGGIDFAYGADGYTKLHGDYGNMHGDFGYIVEGLHIKADGFKELDGGGDTGFDKTDLLTKFQYNMDSARYNQLIELKLAYADEQSNETYLGLSDEDFAANPNRRYAATQMGLMDWEHKQVQLTHHIEFDCFDVLTRAYRNDFERSWRKLNGFQNADRGLLTVLTDPTSGINAEYMAILTGEMDSQPSFGNLIIGTNAREYYSHGIQSDMRYNFTLAGLESVFEGGVRYHEDQIERNHSAETFAMRSGQMTDLNAGVRTDTRNTETSKVWSVYGQNTLNWEKLSLTTGLRGEFINAEYRNLMPGKETDWLNKSSRIWLPSISAFYQVSENLGVLFGVHEGHVPTSPQQHPSIQPEKSLNYELGLRYADNGTSVDLIGFFNDYDNLKESCTFSASTTCIEKVDEEYNGGEVDIYGLEASLNHRFALNNGWEVPVSLVYTYTESEFKQDVESTFSLWGNVAAGDKVPYLPDHQLTLTVGLIGNDWQVSLLTRYVGEMVETSGTGVELEGYSTKAYTVVDLSASYELGNAGSVYLKLDNLFDTVEIVSHRPYGARPSKPQQVVAGYKYRF